MKQRKKFRWHYVYYLLAAFDIVTISASLFLSHKITDIFNDSVTVNTVWASRASKITRLNLLVTEANAPGNNVFENGDVEGESARFEETLATFQSTYDATRREINENVSSKVLILDTLNLSYEAVERLAVEARAVFNSIENGNSQKAGGHMATMDRHYADASKFLGTISNLILTEQEKLFSKQVETAAFYRQFEIIFAFIIGIIIVVVTFYGHIIARRFQEIGDEREAVSSALNFHKQALDEHAIVSIADVEGDITYVNDKFCAISGYERKDLIGRNHNIVKSDEHSDAFWLDMWKTVANGKTWHGEIKNRNKSGDYYWVKTTIVPTMNEEGKPIQYVGIRTEITDDKDNQAALIAANDKSIRDIQELSDTKERLEQVASEQVALSEELAIERDRARAANSAKSDFLSTMSHEIRTPLNGVLGIAQLLRDSNLDEDQNNKVNTILSSGQTLLAIINDVLDMSKIEAGGLELETKAFSLPGLISTITTPFQSLADDKGINLAVSYDIESGLVINGDPVRLRQVLWNLLSNAIKFTEEGRVLLTIQAVDNPETIDAGISSPKDHLLSFAVKDTGAGIAPKRIDAIFDAFTQEDSTITRKHGGTGLGLSIVKQITELMGGSIKVESEVGKGTTFISYIPFDSATNEEVEALSLRATNIEKQKVEPLNIIIAEDNEVNAVIAKAFLTKFGHTVKHVENGLLAVEAAKDDWADLILMDIHMPEMNGIEATKAIRATESGKRIPIVGLTAEAFADRHAQFKEAGMVDVLTKPFTEQQLSDTLAVNRLIDRRNMSRDEAPDNAELPAVEAANGYANNPDDNDETEEEISPIGNEVGFADFRKQLPAEVISKLLEEARSSLQGCLAKLQKAVMDQDPNGIREAAHSIKGSSGSMFATRISEMAAEIEHISDNIEDVSNLLPAFEIAAEDAIKWWSEKAN